MQQRKNSKTRILYLHTGAELYGADQILLSIVSNLDRTQYEPIVVLPNNGPLREELEKRHTRTLVIPYPIIRRKFFTPIGIINYIKQYRKACKELINLVKIEQIDIVHNNTVAVLEGITLKKKTDVILISHIHEMIAKPKIVAKQLYKMHSKAADTIICVSNAVKNHIESMTGKNDKLIVIHNGISPIKCIKTNLKNELGIPKDAKLYTIIGRINAIKGQDDFINAVKIAHKKNEKIYGLIVGDAFSGQEWRIEEIKKRLSEENLSNFIKYMGFTKNISSVYSITNTLVLSSIQYDSFPTVVLEAMSCGIPTIAYRCGGVEEMITDKNGFLVNMGDTTTLSDSMIACTEKNMYKNCIDHFNKYFSLERFIKDYSDLCDSLRRSEGKK